MTSTVLGDTVLAKRPPTWRRIACTDAKRRAPAGSQNHTAGCAFVEFRDIALAIGPGDLDLAVGGTVAWGQRHPATILKSSASGRWWGILK